MKHKRLTGINMILEVVHILENFAIFTGKHLFQILFLNKVEGFRPATLFKETLTQVLSCEFCEILKNTFFIEHLPWLLPKFHEDNSLIYKKLKKSKEKFNFNSLAN